MHLLVSSSFQISLTNGLGLFIEAFSGIMLPDFSDTTINVARIGFCWQLTGSAVARLLGILINSLGGEGVFCIDLLCVV